MTMTIRMHNSPARAVFYMCVGTACLAGTDIAMKYLAADYSLPAILWVRNLMILAAIYLLLRRSGEWAQTRSNFTRLHLVRGAVMGASPIMFYIALMKMPVAEATAILLLMPVMVAIMAVPVLNESLDVRRIIAVCIGFAGVLAIIRPGSEAFSPYTLLALAAAIGSATYHVLTRKLAGSHGAMASLFYPWVFGTVVCTPFAFYNWTPPATPVAWALVALITAMSLAGNTYLVRSYQYGSASLLAPFIYLQLIWAAMLGWVVFDAFPDGWSLFGMFTIVFAGLLLIKRSSLSRAE